MRRLSDAPGDLGRGSMEMMSTEYQGPVRLSEIVVAGQPIRLVRPADPDRLLEHPSVLAWNRRDDYMPYWAYLWPGAFLLAEAVVHEPWPAEGLSALEIGCGLGLAGLAGLGRGMRVAFTDYDEAPLRFVDQSAAENGFDRARYSTERLDWRELPERSYPVILGADVLYEKRLVPLVANLLAKLLSPGGLALIAGPYRVATKDFPQALQSHGLRFDARSVEAESTELGPVRGTLYRVER